MKNVFLCIALSMLSVSLSAQNPISPPGVYIADPSARVMPDGKLYIYGSNDESRKYYCSHRYHVLSTSDMKNWKLTENTFSSVGANDQVPYSDNVLYAPDCIERDGTYYLYYCLAGGGKNEGVATGKSPEGPFAGGTVIEGITQIDPAVFVDDDGRAYLYWGQFSAKGAELNSDMKSVNTATVTDGLVTEEKHRFHEGGWVFKRNGIYYFVYSALSPKGQATAIAYSTATSPLGPFTYGGIILDNYGCDPRSWNNHGSVAEYNGQWYLFYHRSTHASQTMRKACVEKISFLADGSIPQVEMTSQGAADPLDAFSTIQAEWACDMTGRTHIARCGERNEELAGIEHFDTAIFKYLNFKHAPTKLKIRAASEAGGTIRIYTDNLARPLHGAAVIAPGDGRTYTDYEVDISKISVGVAPLRLRFVGEEGKTLFRVDSFKFE